MGIGYLILANLGMTIFQGSMLFGNLSLHDIKSWPEFTAASTDLSLHPLSSELPPLPILRLRQSEKAMETEIDGILTRLELDRKDNFKWETYFQLNTRMAASVSCHLTNSGKFEATLAPSGRLENIQIRLPQEPNWLQVTKNEKQFYGAAAATYQKIYQTHPIGTPTIQTYGKGPTQQNVTWKSQVNGAVCKSRGHLRIDNNLANGRTSITVSPCADLAEIRHLENYLKEKPVLIGNRQAVALTAKYWQQLTKTERNPENWIASVKKGYFNPDKILGIARTQPESQSDAFYSGVTINLLSQDQTWLPEQTKNNFPVLGYFCHVAIAKDLFEIHALINWTTGEIIGLRELEYKW